MKARSLILLATLTLWACDGRPLKGAADGGPLDDGSSVPEFCTSDDQCPAGSECRGCFVDPECPMCAVCMMKCLPAQGCSSNADCAADALCVFESGCQGTGRCMSRPSDCAYDYAPVCGCDGKTYSNGCDAHTAGVSVNHDGACDAKPECEQLRQRYQQALAESKSCCPMCAALQCTYKVTADLACGCDTFVNSTAALKPLQAEWATLGCSKQPIPCPGVMCSPVQGGGCGDDGTCVDFLPD